MSTAPQHAPSHQALYRACMKSAAAQGKTLMQRLVTRAGQAMPQSAKLAPTEQQGKLVIEAMRTLAKHEGALCEAYPQALLAEFAHAIAGDSRKAGALSFDSLELMGDDQMQENVELMRLQQTVVGQVEAELTELNALMCAVQGLKTVQVDRNPLRPEVYVRSLRTVTLQSPVPAAVRARWLQHLGEALGAELARVYGELSAMLRAQGVVEARFGATPSAGSAQPAWTAAAGTPPAAAAQSSTLLNVKELRRLLLGELGEGSAQTAAQDSAADRPEFSATVPAALEVLQEMKQVAQVVQRLKQRQADGEPVPAPGAAALRARLRGQARGAGQALGLEVVGLMVENIASDGRLLPPVQQAVRDLEPALLRLALEDPRFFSDRKHPARRLLDQLTQRSMAWESHEAPGFAAFLEPLRQAVEVLLSTQVGGAEPFEFALKTLEDAWGDAQQRDRHHREKAVRSLLQAEQRNLLAEKISRRMRSSAESAGAPREIAAFLAGPWSQVMAQARLGDQTGAGDPGGYAEIVNDLIWSAQPRLAGANSSRLMNLIPGLVEKLRHGLSTIDYPGAATKKFMDRLAEAHRDALKAGQQPAPPSGVMTRDELEMLLGDDDEQGPWLAPSEAQDSGFMETDLSINAPPVFQQTQPASLDTQAPDIELSPGLPDTGLQPGAWVEMLVDSGWGRYQVSWTSPHGTLFMFAGARGQTHSMTRRLLDKMLKTGTLRMISGQAVVDGALDAVAQTALRNSLHLKP